MRRLTLVVLVAGCSSQSAETREDNRSEERRTEVEEPSTETGAPDPGADPLPSANARLPLRARLRIEASSSYPGWPVSNAVDGDETTSWYSGSNDSVAQGKRPFVYIELPESTPLRTVTILGNRDPSFYNGYAILEGQLDVYDGAGRLVTSLSGRSAGERHDFKFELPRELEGVGALRFTSTRDEGKRNYWGDVAIAEIVLE
jgi:hypothetical protein